MKIGENMKKKKIKVKKMILVLIFLLILLGSILFLLKPEKKNNTIVPSPTHNPTSPINNEKYTKEQKEKLKKLDNIQEELDYFQMEYLDRYVAYSEKNPQLSKKDVIIQVNIGIDQPYYTNTKETPYKNKNYILCNKYLSLGEYVPDNLETVSSEYSSGKRLLVKEAKEAFEKMASAAKEEGYIIRAMSAYRSYQYQQSLYQKYVDQDGKEKADTYSARPGFSEHQTGLVADVDNRKLAYTSFHNTKEYDWMKNNAHKYGWIERYPKGKEHITGYTYESWHYRYVGVEIATYIHEHNITFDEYYMQFVENKK